MVGALNSQKKHTNSPTTHREKSVGSIGASSGGVLVSPSAREHKCARVLMCLHISTLAAHPKVAYKLPCQLVGDVTCALEWTPLLLLLKRHLHGRYVTAYADFIIAMGT